MELKNVHHKMELLQMQMSIIEESCIPQLKKEISDRKIDLKNSDCTPTIRIEKGKGLAEAKKRSHSSRASFKRNDAKT